MPSVNLRNVADKAGVSVATASRALRGLPFVKPAVRLAVKQAAEALGYEIPALVGKVLAEVRRGRGASFAGTLAAIHLPGGPQPIILPFQQEILVGARSRAAELGFNLELFDLGVKPLAPVALGRILAARGTSGIILLHDQRRQELDGFPWELFPAVELDYSMGGPALHTVCIDHHHTMGIVLRELAARGCRRPGLVIERSKDERIENRWTAAFQSQAKRVGLSAPEPLVVERWDASIFVHWFEGNRPDIILGHRDEIALWLSKHSLGEHFFSLNRNESRLDVTGLDLRPAAQGIIAVDTVVGQIHRHERCIPREPCTIMISGQWKDASGPPFLI